MAMSARKAATVANPLVHGGSLPPLLKIEEKRPGLMVNGQPFHEWYRQAQINPMAFTGQPLEITHPSPGLENAAAKVLEVGHQQPLMDYLRSLQQQAQQPMASVKESEALKTIDVEQSEGPSPKIDKRKWTPENVKVMDTEESGSPHPTIEQDVTEPAIYNTQVFEDDGRLDQTDAVTEKQDVTKGTGFSSDKAHGNWPSNHLDLSAVSATDPDKNPIEDIFNEMPSDEEVNHALAEFKED